MNGLIAPTAAVLANRVTLYRYAPQQDADGGVDSGTAYSAAPIAANVPCSVQAQSVAQDDGQGRVSLLTYWEVVFATAYALGLRDKVVWTDASGATRTLFVVGTVDMAGRGGAFGVTCVEKQ